MAQALEYLHDEMDIAHNDIKLGNVFISEDNNCLLADFGFATQKPLTQTSDQLKDKWKNRNQLYMAPELY